jgi:hypothetical protein
VSRDLVWEVKRFAPDPTPYYYCPACRAQWEVGKEALCKCPQGQAEPAAGHQHNYALVGGWCIPRCLTCEAQAWLNVSGRWATDAEATAYARANGLDTPTTGKATAPPDPRGASRSNRESRWVHVKRGDGFYYLYCPMCKCQWLEGGAVFCTCPQEQVKPTAGELPPAFKGHEEWCLLRLGKYCNCSAGRAVQEQEVIVTLKLRIKVEVVQ